MLEHKQTLGMWIHSSVGLVIASYLCSWWEEEQWQKECLVSSVCACANYFYCSIILHNDATILIVFNFIAQHCRVKQSPHGHFFMTFSQCILQLCTYRLYISQRWWELVIIVSEIYTEECQNNTISSDFWEILCMRKQLKAGILSIATPPLSVKAWVQG